MFIEHSILMMTEMVYILEKTMRHASKYQENINSSQVSLFENSSEVQFSEPSIP